MGRTLGVAASLLVLILLTVVAVMTMQAYNELSAADHAVVTAERELERARARQAAARPLDPASVTWTRRCRPLWGQSRTRPAPTTTCAAPTQRSSSPASQDSGSARSPSDPDATPEVRRMATPCCACAGRPSDCSPRRLSSPRSAE